MTDSVYSPTTAPNPKSRWFLVPTEILDLKRFLVKLAEVVLSLVAFIQEEFVSSCVSCEALYLFEFSSCSAFLFTALLLVLLCSPLHQRVGTVCWSGVDFVYTGVMFLLFIISSIIFSSNNGDSSLEKSAVAFGFLASLAFLLDLGLFYKTHGLPWKLVQNQENQNQTNGPASPSEAEKLNENGA